MERGGYDLTGHHEKWVTTTDYLRYDPETGAILDTGMMSVGAIERFQQEGHAFLLKRAQLGVHYVDIAASQPRRRTRSACPAALSGQCLTGLPIPCTVEVLDPAHDATLVQCDDPELAIEFEYPGKYTITVRSVAHTDGVFTAEVSE